MRRTLTTTEAAHLAGVNPRSFARWARRRQLEPLHRMRIRESFVTVWLEDDVIAAGTRRAA